MNSSRSIEVTIEANSDIQILSTDEIGRKIREMCRERRVFQGPAMDRTSVAAILALINKPWSLRELLGALKASDDQEKTADARAAIIETGDKEGQAAVLAWEMQNPHENETGSYLEIGGRKIGPFFSFSELSLKNKTSRIQYEMEVLHDRVMKLRDIIPCEQKPWWKFWGR